MRRAALALFVLAASPAMADQVADVAAAAATAPVLGNAQSVEDQMRGYIDSTGLRAREQRGELKIVTGQAAVMVPETDRNWIAHRSLAYDTALLKATQTYIESASLRISNETTQSFFQAARQEPPPYDTGRNPGQAAELIRKLLALGTAELDGALQKLGVDPKQYAAAQPPQQYQQLRSALLHKTIRDAFGSLTGLTPVQSFEVSDGHGNDTIGVVAVISPLMTSFAQEVSARHGEFQPDPTRAQDLATILGDRQALMHDFGVRRMFDAAGLPVLVSFYQWHSEETGTDPAVDGTYREAAFAQAEARADAQLSDFLAGSAEFHEESQTGQTMEKMAERLPDNYVQQDAAVKDIVNGLTSQMALRSHAQITGISTYTRWTMKWPGTGQPVVGVVRLWSAAGEKAMRAVHDVHPPTSSPAPAVSGPARVTIGRELMTPGDF